MLARLDKKELAKRAKRMRAAAQVPQDLKLKAPTTVVPTFTEDDEETNFGLVFKRKRKVIVVPTEHSNSDRRAPSNSDGPAPSNCAPSASPTQPRDRMVMQEDEGTSYRGKGLGDLDLDVPSLLKETLLPNEEKEKLMTLEKDHLAHETMRQLGKVFAASCLVVTKLKDWRGSANQKDHKIVELHKQMESLQKELQQSKLLRQDGESSGRASKIQNTLRKWSPPDWEG